MKSVPAKVIVTSVCSVAATSVWGVATGAKFSSTIVIAIASDIELVALVGEVLGVIIIVSSSSLFESWIPVNVIDPVVDPAGIVIEAAPL